MSSSNFILEERFTSPFDKLYERVTVDLRDRAAAEDPPGGQWLAMLIVSFLEKRSHWNLDPGLDRYRRQWARLRTKLLRLSAGAYLHVSYDLPRAMADDWPGKGTWSGGPSERSGFALFTKIKGVFDDNLLRAVMRGDVVGMPSYLLRFAPERAVRILGHWLHNLRRGAWQHAQILATTPDRALREAKMREAMATALEDTSTFWPWSSSVLDPPDVMAQSPTAATGLTAFTILANYLPIALSVIALLISLSVGFALQRATGFNEVEEFLDTFGARLDDYMNVAVRDPEGFDSYRALRRGREEPEVEGPRS